MANVEKMQTTQPVNRLRGTLPKMGIRPTIDGRLGGVRESLEAQVMGMARATAQFLTENLRHACGLPVEVVIADTCIGGVSEAATCAEKFAREGVGVSLTVTNCWCYGSETMDMNPHVPKAVWGFNGTERPGAVYLAAVLAGHAQKGLPAFGIYGHDVQESSDDTIPEDVQEKLLQFARAGLAVATMRGASYLAMGGTSMGIAGSVVDPSFFEDYLGMRSESVDMTEFVRRMERGIYDPEEYERALAWVKENCREGTDPNEPEQQRTREQKDRDWEVSVKMALIARDLMNGNPRLAELGYGEEAHGHNALAGGFQGQRQWTDHFPNGDFLEAILTSSFDWNGIRQPYLVATENDAMNGASMLLGHLLTGTAQLFADVRTYWSADAVKRVTGYDLEEIAIEAFGRVEEAINADADDAEIMEALDDAETVAPDGFLHLINSGPAALDWTGEQEDEDGEPAIKPFWEITPEEAGQCLDATEWCPSIVEYFPGGGWSTDFLTVGNMPVTMFRINLVKGLGPVLQIAEGYTIDLPEEVHKSLDERTNPTWPTTWFVPNLTGVGPFVDVYSVMNNWGANHGTICYGHIGGDLITLAAMLRIPVDMHNVPDERIFRPSSWSRFGALEPQSADYRACATYGPLYR
ncbi:MAG TPA: L-fucose isomerase [Abditibacteriaceae bacterium]|nr:L-fucose isomerase [Abditibacteriaceae bacterium]